MNPCASTAPAVLHSAATDRLQTEFVSVVSHELRTPVSAIQGYSDLLLEGAYGELNAGQREIVQYVKESAGGLLDMINNLLSLSLMNRGQTDLVLKTLRMEDLIKEVLMTCRAPYEHKKLSVSYRVDKADLQICSDRIKLQQILTNLMMNAIRYTDRGWIQLNVRIVQCEDAAVPWVELDVADSGAGISAEEQRRIFEQFYRGQRSTLREAQGMGLGLYIVHSLVQMLGGTIGVKSEPGKGSTFTVRLPVVVEEAKALENLVYFTEAALEESNGHGSSAAQQRRVLFLGEDPDQRRLLGENLKKEGLQVVAAKDLREAVEKVASFRPIAIILDPDSVARDGGKLLEDLKLHPFTKTIPVLYFMDSTSQVESSQTGQTPARTGGAGVGKYRILVTDDDPSMREMLQIALESEGYEVLQAADGREALQMLSEQHPDLMLLDLMMPGLNGWEVIDILGQRSDLHSTKVLMLTGASLSEEQEHQLATRTGGLLKKEELKLNHILAGVAKAIGNG